MSGRRLLWLLVIVLIVAGAIIVVIPNNIVQATLFGRVLAPVQGLDLQGGLRVLLEADVPEGQAVTPDQMEAARGVVERRVNGLGVAEPLVQVQGDRRIVVETPGLINADATIATLQSTGLLEFVIIPTGQTPPAEGSVIETYCPVPTSVDCGNPTQSAPVTSALTETTAAGPVYVTLMTGAALSTANVDATSGQPAIAFQLGPQGTTLFATHTTAHVNDFLAIVLDKVVISAPVINSPITGGQGLISGSFDLDSANRLALQLRYGSLPVPLKVVQQSEVGPTLGQDSIRQSQIAGIIGLTAVILFMILYYRLPGIVAAIALAFYAVITFALFVLIPVTLTLPGIAGFILSVGVAVDANILIFERMKEELRDGRGLRSAVDTGYGRAWPSIRDSNVSTLITCTILWFFGSAFGASIVQGFALTLALGVAVSLFTAILVTRTLMHLILDNIDFSERHGWFGI
ncbi:MAG TPA: protein translocase subunit SecD [Anaerolineales bacterium]|nr:protein translocase subunit SecD [Anaerolineales bacterium]